MNRARQLAATEWKPTAIQRVLEREGHGQPCLSTIRRWIDAEYAQRCARQQAAFAVVKRASSARFRLKGESPEYRVAFMRILRAQGVSCRAIGVVHGVVFGDGLSEWQVRQAFRGDDPKVGPVGRGTRRAA